MTPVLLPHEFRNMVVVVGSLWRSWGLWFLRSWLFILLGKHLRHGGHVFGDWVTLAKGTIAGSVRSTALTLFYNGIGLGRLVSLALVDCRFVQLRLERLLRGVLRGFF